jgi:hypothetical protein
MELFVTDINYTVDTPLTLMFLHEDNKYEEYQFAIQQFTANLTPAKEDRYDCTLVVLVNKRRTGNAEDYDQVTTGW